MNKDIKRRDEVLFGSYDPSRYGKFSGGAPRFSNISRDTLEMLLNEDFIDSHDCHNYSPTARDIIYFMDSHTGVTVGGYATSDKRLDYRISIDEILMESSDAESIADFADSFHDADEFSADWVQEKGTCYMRAWWD